MAERVSLNHSLSLPSQPSPPKMAALGGAAASFRVIIPSGTGASNSLASSSCSSLSLLKCLRSSPRISHLFFNQRRAEIRGSSGGYSTVSAPKSFASNPDQLRSAGEDIKELLKTKFCNPILVLHMEVTTMHPSLWRTTSNWERETTTFPSSAQQLECRLVY